MSVRRRGRGAAGMTALLHVLSVRDADILRSLARHRFMTTRQIERLFFADHASELAAARGCRRVLRRLDHEDLVTRLNRRVGGLGAGSATSIWSLAPPGARALSYLNGDGLSVRLREPSVRFVAHSLAVTEVHIRLTEAARQGRFELTSVCIEQESWRRCLDRSGGLSYLKPDLAVVTATPDFEDHWFIEVDLGTEHLPTIVRKCQQYQSYRQTGSEQTDANHFPVVIWLAEATRRADKLRAAIAGARGLDQRLFRVTEMDGLTELVAGGGP